LTISSTCAEIALGIPMPPNCGCPPTPTQPPSANALYASANPCGALTAPLLQVQPCSSVARFNGAITSALILPASSRIAAAVSSSITSARPGNLAHSRDTWKTSLSTKRMSRKGAL